MAAREKFEPIAGFALLAFDCTTLTNTALPLPAPSVLRSLAGTVSTVDCTAAGIQAVENRLARIMLSAPASTATERA